MVLSHPQEFLPRFVQYAYEGVSATTFVRPGSLHIKVTSACTLSILAAHLIPPVSLASQRRSFLRGLDQFLHGVTLLRIIALRQKSTTYVK